VIDSATSPAPSTGGWFVVWTESRAEKKVESRIAALGLEAWLPTVTERRRWSDRWREVVTPLFSGYLFARPAAEWHAALRTPGVLTVVKSEGKPAVLSDQFVQELREVIARGGDAVRPLPVAAKFEPGDEVVVREGPFRGMRGVVREVRGARQLIIWVSAIGRGVACSIGAALVAPAHSENFLPAEEMRP
jgi:transcriptional antiterminator RfaH